MVRGAGTAGAAHGEAAVSAVEAAPVAQRQCGQVAAAAGAALVGARGGGGREAVGEGGAQLTENKKCCQCKRLKGGHNHINVYKLDSVSRKT